MSQPLSDEQRAHFRLKEKEDAAWLFEHYLAVASQKLAEKQKTKGLSLLNNGVDDIDAAYERLIERWEDTFETYTVVFKPPRREKIEAILTLRGELELLAEQVALVSGMIREFETQSNANPVLRVNEYQLAYASHLEEGLKVIKPKGGCFIATAAFHEQHSSVETLRQYRDSILLKTNVGRRFIDAYYHYSPSVANKLQQHSYLKPLIRALLYPIVWLARVSLGVSRDFD